MIDYETLKLIWWLLVGVLLVGFAIMDGHDMGVGTLLPFVGKNDDERRVVINTVGPHWDGNQVWFITGGGAIFAAWPLVYATAFSASTGPCWRCCGRCSSARWASTTAARSTTPPGAAPGTGACSSVARAAADLRRGLRQPAAGRALPLRRHLSTYTGSFWGLLNPFALLAGVVSSAMITLHGATYLAHRTEGDIQRRATHARSSAAADDGAGFVAPALWLQWHSATHHLGHGDPRALPNPLAKTVVAQPGAWLANYAAQPLLWALPRWHRRRAGCSRCCCWRGAR
jgi:cytochrome d ubiquinol oxidase subunit II